MKRSITFEEKYEPAMRITDQTEADAYFEECVQHCLRFGDKTRAEAEAIERTNIGYWAGYHGRATQLRVFKLYRTEHPIFGLREPTADEAFNAGVAWARRALKRRVAD
jgi:hypothetical protein